jgi:predicted nuclease with TOPRIM domain
MDNANMQFLVALILDGLMGIACGWALRWWFHSSRNSQMERAWQETQARLKSVDKNIAAIKEAATDVEAALAARTDELAIARANNCQLRDMISQKTWRVVALEARVAELEPYLTKPVYAPTQLAGLSSTSIGLEFPAVPVSRS